MSNEKSIRYYLIAVIDIIGFKGIFERSSFSEAYKKLRDLINALRQTQVLGSISIRYADNPPRIYQRNLTDLPYFMYSDSALIYKEISTNHIPDTSPEDTVFGEMLMGLEEIFKSAFKQNLWLRGGITYGKAIIKPDLIESNHILIGQPIINADKTEKAQNWMGCAFHNSCSEIIESSIYREEFLVPYPIPVKSDSDVPILNYALGWVDISLSHFISNFDKWETDKAHHEDIKTNTKVFFEKCKNRDSRLLGIGLNL